MKTTGSSWIAVVCLTAACFAGCSSTPSKGSGGNGGNSGSVAGSSGNGGNSGSVAGSGGNGGNSGSVTSSGGNGGSTTAGTGAGGGGGTSDASVDAMTGGRVTIFVDATVPQHAFAAQEIQAWFGRRGFAVDVLPLTQLAAAGATRKVVIADLANATVQQAMQKEGGTAPGALGKQAYTVTTTGSGNSLSYWAIGGDATGTMYGGLDISEKVSQSKFGTAITISKSPAIEFRGTHLYLSVDARTPTYSEDGTSAQSNIPEMWNLEFWKNNFDQMARSRLNLIEFWSLMPFPSLLDVPGFPNCSLQDVMMVPILNFDGALSGANMYNPSWPLVTVKKITMQEKMNHWRAVMQLAADRGIKVYFYNHNIWAYGTENSGYGITTDLNNTVTKAYYKAAIKEMFRIYPNLSGIGITPVQDSKNNGGVPVQFSVDQAEQWALDTYGAAVTEAMAAEPNRDIRLVHRLHSTTAAALQKAWAPTPSWSKPDAFIYDFRYTVAHTHSGTTPLFYKDPYNDSNGPFLPLPAGKKLWLDARTDDQYYMRWGDPDFIRAYLKNVPTPISGFHLGSEGYNMGREFLSLHPTSPRQTIAQKFWYEFEMWGKLGFDPNTPNSEFQDLLSGHFPEVSSTALYNGFASASKVVPLITRFYWGAADFQWYPEACWCLEHGGFQTVTNFVNGTHVPSPWDGETPGLLSVKQSTAPATGKLIATDVATKLQKYGDDADAAIAGLVPGTNMELAETLTDIKGMAHLGRYYAEKILGAVELAKVTAGTKSPAAITHLTLASSHWQKYAAELTSKYVSGQVLTRMGLTPVDLLKIQVSVDNDIKLAGGP